MWSPEFPFLKTHFEPVAVEGVFELEAYVGLRDLWHKNGKQLSDDIRDGLADLILRGQEGATLTGSFVEQGNIHEEGIELIFEALGNLPTDASGNWPSDECERMQKIFANIVDDYYYKASRNMIASSVHALKGLWDSINHFEALMQSVGMNRETFVGPDRMDDLLNQAQEHDAERRYGDNQPPAYRQFG